MFTNISLWCRRVAADLQPSPRAWKGAGWGAAAMVAWTAVIGGWNLKSGFGTWLDLLFAFLIAVLGIPIVAGIVALLLFLLRRLRPFPAGLFVGAFLFLSLLWFGPFGYFLSAVLLLIEAALGASIASLTSERFGVGSRLSRSATVAILATTVIANLGLLFFLRSDGVKEELLQAEQTSSMPAQLAVPNPAAKGIFAIHTLFYGSGTDKRRTEYRKAVALKTETVDASRFFHDFGGWKARVRKLYWGFGMDKLPLNGRVWYPKGPGPFPLVLIVHGNHQMSEFSDGGYAYLGELLASRGFIFVSIDENFLNSGLFHDPPKQQAVRGWMLLEHLKLWHKWNETPGNVFYHRIDLQNVALMGHSRGGEAAATAVLFNGLKYCPDDANIHFDYHFPIKSVVAIAPPDGQYKPAGQWRIIRDVNYFTIQGANDADVSSFAGSRQWDHVAYSGNGAFFKAELYVYRANHGQFNTVWGRTDTGAPGNWLLNLRPLLPAAEQRRIAQIYIAAFLEATLKNRRAYVPLFQDYRRIRDWLPRTLYVNRYLDSSYAVVSNFSEDSDLTTTTMAGGHLEAQGLSVWREGRIPLRSGDRDYNGVFLGWNREGKQSQRSSAVPSYSIELPPGTAGQLNSPSSLVLSIAVSDEEAPLPDDASHEDTDGPKKSKGKPELTDFTLELATEEGVNVRLPLSRFAALLPPIKVRFTKLSLLDSMNYKKASEPIFQTIELPLATFGQQNDRFRADHLRSIRLLFDRTPARVIILSEIAFGKSSGAFPLPSV